MEVGQLRLFARANKSTGQTRASASHVGTLSQATIAGKAYLVDSDTPPVIRRFLEQTLSNNRYDSVQHLQQRAEAYFAHIDAEKKVIDGTTQDLSNVNSSAFRQSAWMGHVERGLWKADGQFGKLDRAVLGDEALGTRAPAEGSPFHGAKGLKLSDSARSAFSMMIKGEEGPFAVDQARSGFEATQTGQVLAGRLNNADRKAYRSANRIDAERSGTHSTKTAEGMDLSRDIGTRIRDKQGLPVMSGTSGSSSDAALAVKYGAAQAGTSWAAPGLSEASAKQAITDLSLNYFRAEGSSPPDSMRKGINQVREVAGLPEKATEAADVFTHS